MPEYIEETTGVLLKGMRKYSNGDIENIDKRLKSILQNE